MPLNPSPTELTTAATDALIGVVCAYVFLLFRRLHHYDPWKTSLWASVFALVGLASVLGTAAHGLKLNSGTLTVLWLPLYLCLGLSVALFLVGAAYDMYGKDTAARLIPWAIGSGVFFFVFTLLLDGMFLVFVLYEGSVMLAVLFMYIVLARKGVLPGAWTVAAAILLNMLAAAVQASDIFIEFIVPFDHNSLFHFVQIGALVLLASGLKKGLVNRDR